MARKPQPAPERPDIRTLTRDAVAEIVALTPTWAALQPAAAIIVEDTSLNIAGSAEDVLRQDDMRERVLSAAREAAPGLFGIGHNQPPEPPTPEQLRAILAQKYPELTKRRDDLLEAQKRFAAKFPAIEDDDTQGRAAEFVKQVGAADKVARAHHKVEKEPWTALGNVVQAFFANVWEPLDAAKKGAVAKMDAYAKRKADESRRKAAEDARRKEEEAAQALAQAAETMEPEDLAAAAQAAETASAAAQHAAGPQAEHSRTRGEFGAVASLTVTYDVAISDFAKLPDEYKLPDLQKLRLALRRAERDRSGAPIFDVAGVEVIRNEGTRVR